MIELFRRRYLISLTYLLIAVVGVVTWLNIPKEMFPEIYEPVITISYNWQFASPEVVEKEVSRRVEGAVSRLRNVTRIQSVSREGGSSVTVSFEEHTPIEYRVIELQEYLQGLQESLPPGVSDPQISRSVPRELQGEAETFLIYTIGGDRPPRDLYRFAYENIELKFLGYKGLSDIEISGAQNPALTLRFDTDLTERYGISTNEILSSIRDRLDWRGAGYIEQAGAEYSLLVPPQFNSVEEIRNLMIVIPGTSRQVQLRDIAQVNIEEYPVDSVKRINGKSALTINFIREGGSDAVKLAETIRSEMEEISALLPPDMILLLEQDSTVQLKENFENLEYQSLFSLLMVFVILLLFIRKLRAPFVILGSIFFSLLISLSVLYFFDYTLNLLTLAGLTVALGMIIDNAVVVFEQINPGLPESRVERMLHIKQELPFAYVPVLGSTLTTIGIFIPLFLAMESLRDLLLPLAVGLTLTLISSAIVALSWIPYALIWLLPATKKPVEKRLKKRLNRLFNSVMLRFFYQRHRYRKVLYLALIFVFGIPLFAIPEPEEWSDTLWPEFTRVYFDNRSDIDPWVGGLTWKFFDETYFGRTYRRGANQEVISVRISPPQGTPFDEVNKAVRSFEMIAEPYAEAFDYYEATVSASSASMTFYINNDYLYGTFLPSNFMGEAMFLAAITGNIGVSVSGLGESFRNGSYVSYGFSGGIPVYLTGYSYDDLMMVAEDIAQRVLPNPRVSEVGISGGGNLQQYVLRLDDEKLIERGLSRQDVVRALQLDINPINSQRGFNVELSGQQVTLLARSDESIQYEEALFNRPRTSNGRYFTLDDVGDLEREVTMPSITRDNQSYSRTVYIDFLGPREMGSNFVESVIAEVPVPIGTTMSMAYNYSFNLGSGDQTRNYVLMLFMTILSVWMIVSALLENWRDPLIVILSVPLSLIGIMTGILIHEINFDQGAIAGTLLAVGVVVNNAILLVHEKERIFDRGVHGFRSWVKVYRNKMRAVMITSLTTMGGLTPLIWFSTDESILWHDLAIVVIWGLFGSLTLLLLYMGIWEKDNIEMPESFYKRRIKGRVTVRSVIQLPGRIWRTLTIENLKRLPERVWRFFSIQNIKRLSGNVWNLTPIQRIRRFTVWIWSKLPFTGRRKQR